MRSRRERSDGIASTLSKTRMSPKKTWRTRWIHSGELCFVDWTLDPTMADQPTFEHAAADLAGTSSPLNPASSCSTLPPGISRSPSQTIQTCSSGIRQTRCGRASRSVERNRRRHGRVRARIAPSVEYCPEGRPEPVSYT